MSHKFFKPIKKFVSRKTAIERLKITESQFNRLVVLCGVYPVVTESKNCYDREEGWYYMIEDIKKIFYSETYDVLIGNLDKAQKRERFLKVDQISRAGKFVDEEFNFVGLVKQKYESLASSIENLGYTLKTLYLIDSLKIDDVKEDLKAFEEFLTSKKLLNKAFLSTHGVYFGFDVEKIMVVWMVPYPGTGLEALVEEKIEVIRKDTTNAYDFLDLGDFSESESELENENKQVNDENKFDISLLKYSSPLLKIHLKLVLYKLKLLLENSTSSDIFKGTRFYVDMPTHQFYINLVVVNAGGQLTDLENADIVITELVENIHENKKYIQPQYVFDCLNTRTKLPYELYTVGVNLPPHKSPFPNVLENVDARSLKMLSNKKKYSILDRVEKLN